MNNEDILLKKWELLWNHYKLQNECLEKRRNFLWIIQALIFTGWYKLFFNENPKAIYVAFILSLVGLFMGILWLFILNRERRSTLISEQCLRDTEVEWNILVNNDESNIELTRFILDYELLNKDGTRAHIFKYKPYKFEEPTILERKSAGYIMNKVIPIIIIFVWVLLILITTLPKVA